MWVYRYGEISHSSAVSERKRYKDCTSIGESLYFLYFREKKWSMLTQPKEEKQRKYRQSVGFIVLMNVGNATGGKRATYGNNQESNLRNTQRLEKQENNF
ncbi:hypothetical protein DW022_01525 [Ruminococcus sp. AF37-6AT]|jgi:hypothetical protein|nr:hypothetical protein DW098_07795 [Ruminococcus sp. AM07-21]RHL51346.1 hypothetical protein DW022_01525 [Ruminococcus sp. AF37-6AT]RHO81982.1 hypothetical protein DW061_19035 [Ruminococcus sp. AF42-9BH]RHP59434.1 hypothetical protein DWZ27_03000 [Ruminococcus sp. AF31-16BH]